MSEEAFIYEAIRTPRGKQRNGSLNEVKPLNLVVGLVDELLPTVEELVPAAKAWIKANPESHTQPWDVKGYKIPGGTPSSPALAPSCRRSRRCCARS